MANNRKNMINTPMDKNMKKRLNITISIFLLAIMVYIIINLFVSSVVNAEKYKSKAASQQVKTLEIEPNRGYI